MQWIYHLSIFIKNNISYLNLFGWGKHALNSYIKGGFLLLIFFGGCVLGGVGDKSHKKNVNITIYIYIYILRRIVRERRIKMFILL